MKKMLLTGLSAAVLAGVGTFGFSSATHARTVYHAPTVNWNELRACEFGGWKTVNGGFPSESACFLFVLRGGNFG